MKKLITLAVCSLFLLTYGKAQDSAGTYQPIVSTNHVNTVGSLVADSAHFIQHGNQVAVWGHVSVGAVALASGTRTYFQLSLPVGTHAKYPDGGPGILVASQRGTHDNTSGYVFVNPAGNLQFIWNATTLGNVSVYYSYCYTVIN